MEETTNDNAKMSLMSKLINIFTSPEKVFKNLDLFPDWLIPTILVVIVSLISVYALQDITLQVQKDKIAASEKLSEEQKDQRLEIMENTKSIQVYTQLGGVIVYTFASYLLVAALFLFSGNVILGGTAKYGSLLAVYAWGSLVYIPEAIIKIPLMLQKGSIHVYTSLAVLFDNSASETVLFKIANAFDIFSIWRIVLWIMGISIVYKFSKGKATFVVVTWHLIWIVVSIALSSLAASFV
jgi:hypothetical protein